MSKTIFIIGMHRSGTSLATNLIYSLLKQDDSDKIFFEADEANVRGYFEEKEVVKINNRILELMGGNSWSVFEQKDLSDKDNKEINQMIKKYLDEGSDQNIRILKDPRFCLTIDYWLKHIDKEKILFNWREPIEVAYSLRKRGDDLSVDECLSLWNYYNEAFFKSGAVNKDVYYLRYVDIFEDIDLTLSVLTDMLDLTPKKEVYTSYLEVVDPSLRSNRIKDYKYVDEVFRTLEKLGSVTKTGHKQSPEINFTFNEVEELLRNYSVINDQQLAKMRKRNEKLSLENKKYFLKKERDHDTINYLRDLLKIDMHKEDYYQKVLIEHVAVLRGTEAELDRVNHILNSFTVRNSLRFKKILDKTPFVRPIYRFLHSKLIFIKSRLHGS